MPGKIAVYIAKILYDVIIWMVAVAILNTLTALVKKSWRFLRTKTASRKATLAPAK